MPAYTYRRGTVDDTTACHKLSLACGWLYGLQDFRRFLSLALDIRICCLADAEGDDAVVGMGICTTFPGHGDAAPVGLIGTMLTHPSQRHQGIGRKIFQDLVEASCERGEVPRLVATDLGRKVYSKNGFVNTEASTLKRFQCGADILRKLCDGETFNSRGVKVALTTDEEMFAAVDKESFGADRGQLFARLVTDGASGDGKCSLLLAWEVGNDTPIGYAFVRLEETKKSVQLGPYGGSRIEVLTALIGSAARLHVDVAKSLGLWVRADIDLGKQVVSAVSESGLECIATVTDMIKADFKERDTQRKETYVGLISPSWG